MIYELKAGACKGPVFFVDVEIPQEPYFQYPLKMLLPVQKIDTFVLLHPVDI